MNENSEPNRVFLVGCPRSGTTLLQSLLCAHPYIASFPESHFFAYLAPVNHFLASFGVTRQGVRRRLLEYAESIDELIPPPPIPMLRNCASAYVDLMDRAAKHRGCTFWLDKTPQHLHHIPLISKYVKGARFVHLLRTGKDAIASLYDVTHRYPDAWGGARSLENCTTRWIGDAKLSLSYSSHGSHKLVSYTRLVSSPQDVLSDICDFLDIPFDESMLKRHGHEARRITTESEPWKTSASGEVDSTLKSKFKVLFDEKQQMWVTERLCSAGLNQPDQSLASKNNEFT